MKPDTLKQMKQAYIKNSFENTILGKTAVSNTLNIEQTYRELRIKKNKSPGLIRLKQQRSKFYEKHIFNDSSIVSLAELISIQKDKLMMGDVEILSFGTTEKDANIYVENLDLLLTINEAFFKFIDQAKGRERSQSAIIARSFFKFQEKDHFTILMYLDRNESTSEHYHQNPEVYYQVSGKAALQRFSIHRETDIERIDMQPGMVVKIENEQQHRYFTEDSPSVWFVVKKIARKKDHLFYKRTSNSI